MQRLQTIRNLEYAYIMVNSDVAKGRWARGEGKTGDMRNQQHRCVSIVPGKCETWLAAA